MDFGDKLLTQPRRHTFTPPHGRFLRRRRHYLTHSLIERERPKASDAARRVPVGDTERLVEERKEIFGISEPHIPDSLVSRDHGADAHRP